MIGVCATANAGCDRYRIDERDDEEGREPHHLLVDDARADQQPLQRERERDAQRQQDQHGRDQVVHDRPAVLVHRLRRTARPPPPAIRRAARPKRRLARPYRSSARPCNSSSELFRMSRTAAAPAASRSAATGRPPPGTTCAPRASSPSIGIAACRATRASSPFDRSPSRCCSARSPTQRRRSSRRSTFSSTKKATPRRPPVRTLPRSDVSPPRLALPMASKTVASSGQNRGGIMYSPPRARSMFSERAHRSRANACRRPPRRCPARRSARQTPPWVASRSPPFGRPPSV
jgi:hypothetical protein